MKIHKSQLQFAFAFFISCSPHEALLGAFETHYAHNVLFHHGMRTGHLAESCENKGS